MSSTSKPASTATLAALPEHMVGEIIGGELHARPRPAPRHAKAATDLGFELLGPFGRGRGGGPGGWIILAEPELHFGEDILVPDLAGWRRERLRVLPESAITVAPDWICEILSPGTARKDRGLKLPIYAAQGVAHARLVDPVAQTVEVYRLENGHWLLLMTYGGDVPMAAEPFAAVTIDLGRIWAW